MIETLLKKIFGSKSARDIKRLRPLVTRINQLEQEYQALSDEQLKAKTLEFRERYAKGETLDSMLCEAFAVVKNACRRMMGQTYQVCGRDLVWDMIPFDVQLLGGIVLHQGKIAEMATGEGKTLVAAMPLYLNAMTGKNCQLVTVNDYLALRDSQWVGRIFEYLGLTVGCIQNSMHPAQRKAQYACDITYGTNSEFGFDYLRDMGMAADKEHLVQRDYYYVIIDEVDSILIDEARTPLIISGPVNESTHQFDKLQPLVDSLFQRQNLLCSRFIREAKGILDLGAGASEEQIDQAIKRLLQVKFGMPRNKQLAHILEDASILKRLERMESYVRSDQNRGLLQEVQGELFFSMDEKQNEADLTELGRNTISPNDPDAFVLPDLLNSIHDIENDENLNYQEKLAKKQQFQLAFATKSERLQNISQLLRAYCLFEKDVHYVVMERKVLIVDEHTGRILPGRRFSDGLHQALEAKEGVTIEQETQTLATITIQNYFRMYDKLAGMTGTAETEATELHQIYKLDVVVIPTNRPCIRKDLNDCVYKTKREKFRAIVDETEAAYKRGQPVLLGTISVEDSELISRMLKLKNIPHNVLNAKNHARESEIIANAGQRGSVTVATNMAGRGTDIKLGEGIADLGGLLVLGSSRHDARRIDRQLRGRCGRQGDPGTSHFYVSLEDNLMRLFGSDRIVAIMDRLGMDEGEELQHPLLSRSIETAQRRVEQQHFAIRKRTLEYDDVMNKQREVIYGFRRETLFSDDCTEAIFNIIEIEVGRHVDEAITLALKSDKGAINKDLLIAWLNLTFPIGFDENDIASTVTNNSTADTIIAKIMEKIRKAHDEKASMEDPNALKWLERSIVLEAIDTRWQEHLRIMDELRSSIGLRSYAQKDPLVEYKREAFKLFEQLMLDIDQDIISKIFRSATNIESFQRFVPNAQEIIRAQMAAREQAMREAMEEQARRVAMEEQALRDEIAAHDIQVNADVQEQQENPDFTINASNTPETSSSISIDNISASENMAKEEEKTPQKQQNDRPPIPPYIMNKVGPNDPCPCGSGKKFKKCCGR